MKESRLLGATLSHSVLSICLAKSKPRNEDLLDISVSSPWAITSRQRLPTEDRALGFTWLKDFTSTISIRRYRKLQSQQELPSRLVERATPLETTPYPSPAKKCHEEHDQTKVSDSTKPGRGDDMLTNPAFWSEICRPGIGEKDENMNIRPIHDLICSLCEAIPPPTTHERAVTSDF